MEAATTSHRKAPDEPARLCEACRVAHYAALSDNSSGWKEDAFDGNTPRIKLRGHTHTQILPADRWPGLPRLLGSAEFGCGFCALLREAILSTEAHDAWGCCIEGGLTEAFPSQLEFAFTYCSGPWVGNGLQSLEVKVTHEITNLCIHLRFRIEADPYCPAVAYWLELQPPASEDYHDNATTAFLKAELQKLPVDAENDDNSSYYLPDRLIDVSTSNLRLVEGNRVKAGSAIRQHYAALSYCWGPPNDADKQSKTTLETLGRHFQSLEFGALSAVLQDVVKTTRNLSIPYLWVDSLCILQDDILDWQRQCSQMNDIYGKAWVTLIAASSRTCNEGFLVPKRRIKQGMRFPYKSSRHPDISGSFVLYFTHAISEAEYVLRVNEITSDLTFCQWARRGWTFQEHAMAGARIVFGVTDVYIGRDSSSYVSRNGDADFQGVLPVTHFQNDDELHDAWEEILQRYSVFTAASFTNSTDLLPALSGLARLYGNILQETYVAGHWASRLHQTLFFLDYGWGTSRPSMRDIVSKHYSQKPYLVPTWSRLAHGLTHSSIFHAAHSEVALLDIHVQLVSEDPYGAIQNASLTLEGYVLDLASLFWFESPTKKLLGSTGSRHDETNLEFKGGIKYRETLLTLLNPAHSQESAHEGFELTMSFDFKDETKEQDLEPLQQLLSQMKMLLLGRKVEDNHLGEMAEQGYGLLLLPLESAPARCFIRAGVFWPESLHAAPKGDHSPRLKSLMKKDRVTLF
ncbi:hypothetical protein N0V93_000188 [Gnomoniopsis smithogilvyi]|uniref:Heterokaryon incompatibility domain-containing protein n=1 Tax=Gnomoniopsis smithogilvyi TaxID=1191159 RepID=A0A9W9D001_9PEZI|nr:hypothetical protein N0V93_000188 [Gnomoniopsis smithogilvyi]